MTVDYLFQRVSILS